MRHKSSIVYLWLMNGTSLLGSGSPGAAGGDWTIQGALDFNGDGKADILWQHSSGVVYIWLMNGPSLLGTGSPGSADSNWTIQ
jgi:FG-GAP repeat protein